MRNTRWSSWTYRGCFVKNEGEWGRGVGGSWERRPSGRIRHFQPPGTGGWNLRTRNLDFEGGRGVKSGRRKPTSHALGSRNRLPLKK